MMISQSIHFEVTGNDAEALILACHRQGIQPIEAFNQFIAQFTKHKAGETQATETQTTENKPTFSKYEAFNFDLERMDKALASGFVEMPDDIETLEDFDRWLAEVNESQDEVIS